jgi:microsomal dipeptidase-like Zn-dependent dipeptidase
LNIGNIVPLERSNFACNASIEWCGENSENPFEKVLKMLTHLHKVGLAHLGLAHLKMV